MSILSQTTRCTLVLDPVSGLPTGIVAGSAKKETIIAGTIAGLTSQFSETDVVKGIGATAAVALVAYGSMQLARKRLVGNFAFNPIAQA